MTEEKSAAELFDISLNMRVPVLELDDEHIPEVDHNYVFDPQTTEAILAGFAHNRRVLVQGFHGTGKTSHIEQVAARLNWPCIRVNLDGHITRMDLIGRDIIVIEDGQQLTRFQPGILTWALQHPCALIFDEYDAGRPDVMFVLQRVLESDGKLTLLDQNKVITPHPQFRLFATANTIGLGDSTGLYHGTQPLNQAQLDRWHIVTTLNYLAPDQEQKIVLGKIPQMDTPEGHEIIEHMVLLADLVREGFVQGDLSTTMSPRTVISWAQNFQLFNDIATAFQLSFLNKCDETERPIVAEYFQRCFDQELRV